MACAAPGGRGARLAAAALALTAALPALAELPVPRLTGPVVDEAGLLDARSVQALTRLCVAARQQEGGGGVQLQYLIVPSLDGEPIESFSIRVAEAWKIGSKGRDNGVLVVVALQDRAVRIEVGGGIEGALTDAQAGRIIRGTIAPAFRRQDYGGGLYAAGEQILAALGALPRGVGRSRGVERPGVVGGLGTLLILGFLLVLFLVRVFSGFGPRRRGPWWWGGPWGGGWGGGSSGGGGWSGGGGGGWSGGGGGFSGGGASGRW